MNISRQITKQSFAFIILLTAIVILGFGSNLFKPKKIVYEFDKSISHDYKYLIKDTIKNIIYTKKIDINLVKEKIKESFEPIDYISIKYLPSRKAIVKINAFSPLIILEDTDKFYITKNGLIVDTSLFENYFLLTLNTIFVYSLRDVLYSNALKDLIDFSLLINQKIFNDYRLYWRNKTEIILTSKKYNKFNIICDVKTIINEELLKKAEIIYLKKQNKNKGLNIDIRFRDLIICAPLGEGNNEKKGGN